MKAKIIKSEEIGEILVDLTNKNRGTAAVGKQWCIELEPPTVKKLFQKFGLKIEKSIQLILTDISAPDLVCKENLMSVIFDGREYTGGTIINTTLTMLNTPFQVFLNTKAIIDSKEKQQEKTKAYPVTFTISLKDSENDTIVTEQPVRFFVVFREVKTVPEVKINMLYPSLEYDDKLGEVEIGKLSIKNVSPLYYYPNVDINLLFVVRDRVTGLKCDNIYIKLNDGGKDKIEIGNMGKSQEKIFSIMANMPLIGNPISQEQFAFDIVASTKYNHVGQSQAKFQLPDCETSFIVSRNTTKPQLKVEMNCDSDGNWIYLHSDKNYVYNLPCVSYSLESELFWPCFSINISNVAKTGAPGVGVVIRNFRCVPSLGEYTEARFARRKTIEQVFKTTEKVPELFKLEHSQSENIEVGFCESDIKGIFTHHGAHRDYTSDIYFDVSFEYWDDNANLNLSLLPESRMKSFEIKIRVPVFQSASSQWLGIDYGTSAIVCRYGNIDINLKEKKKTLFPNDEDHYEEGTPYLSSNVILRNNRNTSDGIENSDLLRDYPANTKAPDFNSLAVTLSPTSAEEDRNVDFILPCLKMLVGYEKIPNIEQYDGFSYELKDDDGNIVSTPLYEVDENGDVISSELCNVDTVMCEAYKELFTYYVKEKVPNMLMMNNIVLTVPNTFSPNHFEQLRKLIDDSFTGYNIRNLKFISESDAVACFYLSHWSDINHSEAVNRTDEDIEILRDLENVLVFDMGGGTLDITYLTRHGINNIDVRGRMGIAKAGNYLDGLLAQLIAKRIQQLEKVVKPELITDTERLIAARKLKDLIKNQLKPKMSRFGETITISRKDFGDVGVRQDFIINVDDIIQEPKFQEYVKSCTVDVLRNFITFFNLYNEDGRVAIDTVIISGRSSKLPQIRHALIAELRQIISGGDFCSIDMSTVLSIDKSKDVVVEGALSYASRDSLIVSSDNIMANYGVIYYDAFGAAHYQELLNPRKDKPISKTISEGMTINSYKTQDIKLDLSGCQNRMTGAGNNREKMLTLVQTYSLDTLRDWEKGLNEYITIMATYNIPTHIDRSCVALHLEVNNKNQMRLFMNKGFSQALAPALIDVNSELNKRSMWPVKYK